MAKTGTYSLIASNVLSGTSTNISFASIPQTFTDLRLIIDVGNTGAGNVVRFKVNSDTGSNYSWTELNGNGTSATSARAANQTVGHFDGISNSSTTVVEVITADFMDYANTTTNKTILSRAGNANYGVDAFVSLWRSTSAITQIDVFPQAGSFISGSTFRLYGIQAYNGAV